MGHLSLKKLVELTGYSDSKFVSVSSDSYVREKEEAKTLSSGQRSGELKSEDVFSHRRALRVV